MIENDNEIEIKLAADKVEKLAFVKWAMSQAPVRSQRVLGPDVYYQQGDNVVRHRLDRADGRHELTVKRRKSYEQTTDRVEIDLRFDKETSVLDVQKFLEASGWSRAFTVVKNAHIFWYEEKKGEVTVVIYDVWKLGLNGTKIDSRRYIEVEIEKGSPLSSKEAGEILAGWHALIKNWFDVGEPLNQSLYEIYSGNKYKLEGSGNERNSKTKDDSVKGTRRRNSRKNRRGTSRNRRNRSNST